MESGMICIAVHQAPFSTRTNAKPLRQIFVVTELSDVEPLPHADAVRHKACKPKSLGCITRKVTQRVPTTMNVFCAVYPYEVLDLGLRKHLEYVAPLRLGWYK